jgi:DNA repair exonuclease SbcCD nuclease subunit
MRIILADLHLTNNSLDEYRWSWLNKFTEWLLNYAESRHKKKKEVVTEVIILGDLTENKDKHTESLVNRFIDVVTKWYDANNIHTTIIAGNHDGIDSRRPFFRFVNMSEYVKMYYDRPVIDDEDNILYLPHSRTPVDDWEEIKKHVKTSKYIFMHQSVDGAKTSSGFEMEDSVPSNYFKHSKAKIFSGDIHVPQFINNVTYIGSPFPIYFGDNFEGRFALIDKNDVVTFKHIPSIHKWKLNVRNIKQIKEVDIQKDDQLNVEYTIDRTEQHTWTNIRDEIREYVKKKRAVLVSLELIVPRSDVSLKHDSKKTKRLRSDTEFIKSYSDKNELDMFHMKVALDIVKATS